MWQLRNAYLHVLYPTRVGVRRGRKGHAEPGLEVEGGAAGVRPALLQAPLQLQYTLLYIFFKKLIKFIYWFIFNIELKLA